MKYDLKKPCNNCPFVVANDFRLHPERIGEIADAFEFACHKTTHHDDDDGETYYPDGTEQHCFGHLVVQWSDYGSFNKGTAMAARFGVFHPHELPTADESGCFETFDDYITREEER